MELPAAELRQRADPPPTGWFSVLWAEGSGAAAVRLAGVTAGSHVCLCRQAVSLHKVGDGVLPAEGAEVWEGLGRFVSSVLSGRVLGTE